MEGWELRDALDNGLRFQVATPRGGVVFKDEDAFYHHELPGGGGSSASDWPLFHRHATFRLAELVVTHDCRFCNGQQTVQPTYHGESEYGAPYICHACMKDQRDGYTWQAIPKSLTYATIERGEDVLFHES